MPEDSAAKSVSETVEEQPLGKDLLYSFCEVEEVSKFRGESPFDIWLLDQYCTDSGFCACTASMISMTLAAFSAVT